MPHTFPTYYPQNCPPTQESRNGEYYKLTHDTNHSNPDLYATWHSRGVVIPSNDPDIECERCATSIFDDRETLKRHWKLHRNLGDYMATFNLTGSHGVVSLDKRKKHYCWWVPDNVNPLNFLTLIEKI